MEFVPFHFCDSVVFLSHSRKVVAFAKLRGYWSEAARKESNHHTDGWLELQPIGGDRWNYSLCRPYTVTPLNWRELIATDRCLVIHQIDFFPGLLNSVYEEISTSELKTMLQYGYKKPLEVSIPGLSSEQSRQTANLIEGLNAHKIWMGYAPEFHQFLVNAFSSQHLLSATVVEEIPDSLHPLILEWAQRTEIDQMWMYKTPNLKFEFSVFEKIMQRIQKMGTSGRTWPINAYFSEDACARIEEFLGTDWNQISSEMCRIMAKVVVDLRDSGRCVIYTKCTIPATGTSVP